MDIEARAGRPGGAPADPVVAGQCVEACSCARREEASDSTDVAGGGTGLEVNA